MDEIESVDGQALATDADVTYLGLDEDEDRFMMLGADTSDVSSEIELWPVLS